MSKDTDKHPAIYDYIKYKYINVDVSNLGFDKINVEHQQNYNPLFKLLFKLNGKNSNSISLDNKYKLAGISDVISGNTVSIECVGSDGKREAQTSFIKYAPLIDPFQYLCGKQIVDFDKIQEKLPSFNDKNDVELASVTESPFNPAYVDGFCSYLSSKLKNSYGFKNGIDFYGSYSGIKSDFKVAITDDLTLLNNSTFFMEHKNKLFNVDEIEYDDIDTDETHSAVRYYNSSMKNKEPIRISEEVLLKPDNLDEVTLDSLFSMEGEQTADINGSLREVVFNVDDSLPQICLHSPESCGSDSDCSSRTSVTSFNFNPNGESNEGSENGSNEGSNEGSDEGSNEGSENDSDESDGSDDGEHDINAYIKKFPANVIFLEKCEQTLDHYIVNADIEELEMKAIMLQLLFSLATYQHCFDFTHNDLHTNNIMYSKTDEKYLYYSLDNNESVFKIPTYGKIWKIIDFGRAIYKISNQTVENMCYSELGDATTQYNFGRLHCDKYRYRGPNKYFDLCRLGCSLFDYFINMDEDQDLMYYDEEMKQVVLEDDDDTSEDEDEDGTASKSNGSSREANKYTIENLILKWMTDSDNHNILYKASGEERYPGFKLYKMIAIKADSRCCPIENIKSPYFKEFVANKKERQKIRRTKNSLFVVNNIPKFYVDTIDQDNHD